MDEHTGSVHRRVARQSIELGHDPTVVWRLFTDADHLEHWLGRGATIDARPGGAVVTSDPVSGRPKRGRVDRIDDGRSIELTWWDDAETADSEASVVRFDLIPTVAGTRLTVTETAIPRSVARSTGGPQASSAAAAIGNAASNAAASSLWAWRLAMFAVATTASRSLTAQPIR